MPTPLPKDTTDLVVEVHIRRDPAGRIHSNHTLRGESDQAIAMSWPGGGQEQIAFALLVEAIRREAIVEVLLCMSQDPQFIPRMSEGLEDLTREMTGKLKAQLAHTLEHLSEDVIRDALHRVSTPTPG